MRKHVLTVLVFCVLTSSIQAYTTLSGRLTNYVFRGDTTYYISGKVMLYGTPVFEAGTVIKYTNKVATTFTGSPVLLGTAYRPVIFTAKDDNSVGETIFGSTGNPTNYYAAGVLNVSGAIQYVRIAFANTAFSGGTLSLTNVQIINCQTGIDAADSLNINMRNVLMANVQNDFDLTGVSGDAFISAQNVTFANASLGQLVLQGSSASWGMMLTNCILVNINIGTNASHVWAGYNGFYPAYTAFGYSPIETMSYPFQTVGAASYYLPSGSIFRGVGMIDIDPNLSAILQTKTTYPPLIYNNQTNYSNVLLEPAVSRDNNSPPDLGYHYDPIDYIVDNYAFNNATLTVLNGSVLATYNNEAGGLQLQDSSTIVCVGAPLIPNWFIRYSSVQEQPLSLGGPPSEGITIAPCYSNVAPTGWYEFTKFACTAGSGIHLYDNGAGYSYGDNVVLSCEFWSGSNTLGGSGNSVAEFDNDLFARSVVDAAGTGSVVFTNNLFYGVESILMNSSGNSSWYAFDNDFDSSTISGSNVVAGYNAYLNCTGQLSPSNGSDFIEPNSLNYESGPLGTFYQPANSPLINAGNTTADQVGLYYFTVTTNEIAEGTNPVSIGYHYVALNITNGSVNGANPYPSTNGIPPGGIPPGGLQPGGSGPGGVNLGNGGITPGIVSVLHFFDSYGDDDGGNPYGAPVLSGNRIYGTASGGGTTYLENAWYPWGSGTIYALNTDGTQYETLYNFSAVDTNFANTDGASPEGDLLLEGNTLYGTTYNGGQAGNGTVFAFNISSRTFNVLYSFSATDSIGINGDGAHPVGGLVSSGNMLYGTATWGGNNGNGTVFAVSMDGTLFTTLYEFSAGESVYWNDSPGSYASIPVHYLGDFWITNSDGANPVGTLVLSGETLYGTTATGGTNGTGTVFAINMDGAAFTDLHHFQGFLYDQSGPPDYCTCNDEGGCPYAGMILSGSTLYGTTLLGGMNLEEGLGTVFSLSTNGTDFTTLCDLGSPGPAQPSYPRSRVVLLGETLYGTIGANMTDGFGGSIYSVNTNGTGLANVWWLDPMYTIEGIDVYTGGNSYGALIASGSTLYGTTCGTSMGSGAVFMFQPPVP